MNIVQERTRLMITDFTRPEQDKIELMVSRMDYVYLYYDPDTKTIGLPPGLITAMKHNFPFAKITDNSNSFWTYNRIQPVTHNAAPRNQLQNDFINFVLDKSKNGQKLVGILSTGTGKTFMACYSAIKLGLKTLIIAPTSSIKQQWGDTLTGMFNVPKDRVIVTQGPRDIIKCNADFVVTSQASLAVLNRKYNLEDILRDNKFGIKVIDEVQMFFKNIIMVDCNSNIANNWYLTGTFGRSDETENKIYREMFGDLEVFREEDKKPTFFDRKPGNIYGMKPHCYIKMIWGHSGIPAKLVKDMSDSKIYSQREGMWVRFGINVGKYINWAIPIDGTMTKYLEFILKIIKQGESEVKYGKSLVLLPTISACHIVMNHLYRMFPNLNIRTINSHQSRKENATAKAEADMLVSTVASCGTGFDFKGLSKLYLFSPLKSWILTMQILGRNRRRDDGRPTYMWDLVDADVTQFRTWGNVRADIYKKRGKQFTVEEWK